MKKVFYISDFSFILWISLHYFFFFFYSKSISFSFEYMIDQDDCLLIHFICTINTNIYYLFLNKINHILENHRSKKSQLQFSNIIDILTRIQREKDNKCLRYYIDHIDISCLKHIICSTCFAWLRRKAAFPWSARSRRITTGGLYSHALSD